MERESKITRAAGIFATVVGTFKVIGILSGVYLFTRIGQTFAISPSPSPFSHVSAADPDALKSGAIFGCEDITGQVSWHRWNYEVRGAVSGPHRRIVTMLSYFGSIGRFISNDLGDRRMQIQTQFNFCKNGPIAQAAACPPNIAAVIFANHDPQAPEGVGANRTRLPCSK